MSATAPTHVLNIFLTTTDSDMPVAVFFVLTGISVDRLNNGRLSHLSETHKAILLAGLLLVADMDGLLALISFGVAHP